MSAPEVEEEDDEEDDDCSDADASEVDFCDSVTVGAFEACVKAYLGAFKRQVESISCADAGEEPDFGAADTPAACEEIEEKCPGLLAGIGGEEEVSGGL